MGKPSSGLTLGGLDFGGVLALDGLQTSLGDTILPENFLVQNLLFFLSLSIFRVSALFVFAFVARLLLSILIFLWFGRDDAAAAFFAFLIDKRVQGQVA